MEILNEFLSIFLQKRNLPYPDGRMLYAYQMNRSEYNDLQNKLKICCQNYSLAELLKNKYFHVVLFFMLLNGGSVSIKEGCGLGTLYFLLSQKKS